MQLRLILLSIVIAVLTGTSCKKDKFPDEVVGQPEFYITGTLGGQSLQIDAGKEDYYMETFYESDTQNILVFGGTLLPLSAVEGRGGLTFLIRNNVTGSSAPEIESSLQPGMYEYRVPNRVDTNYRVHFNALLGGTDTTNVTYTWNFGDSSSASGAKDPVHVYTDGAIYKYNVCLTASNDSVTSSLCTDIFMPPSPCTADISVTQNTPTFLTYNGFATGSAPFKYEWSFTTTGQTALSQHVDYEYHTLPPGGVETACLTVTDFNNCASVVCANVIFNTAPFGINLDYTVETVTVADSTDFSTVIIEYIDEQGRLFTSRHPNQPVASVFEIQAQDSYQNNRFGNRTRRLEINTDCWLYTANGTDSLKLNIEKGVIAVAYP